jgi:hypothetical protein
MAALLVMLGVMSVLMTAMLPAWRFQAKREKELELVFRGEQYIRAIALYERRMGPGSRPPTLDALVQQRFIRKKYKDPMTKDGEFQVLYIGANAPAPPGPGGRGQPGVSQVPGQTGVGSGLSGGQPGMGGILGVVSKSKESSIRVYQGNTRYDQWRFVFAGAANRPGMPPGAGRGVPGMGGRGMPQPGLPGGRRGEPGRGAPGMPGRGVFPGGRGQPGPIIR